MRTSVVLITTLLALTVGSSAIAQSYAPGARAASSAPRQAVTPNPATLLEQGMQQLIDFAGQQPTPERAAVVEFVNQHIAPYFDFSYMARWAGGRSWPGMDERQRSQLTGQVKEQFLSTLVQQLLRYDGQRVRVFRPRPGRGNEVSVPVALVNPRGYPARLTFRFYRADAGWKIFDVMANGSSAVMHYRKQFARIARQRQAPMPSYPVRR